ncbi:L-amino acid oxidase [Plectosphaerella plurivora]|uniref:L-amino acid oxidase n=1 Tax=Plectosphaerella plurivora TaxID=936078 RepID=A0A9P8VBP5_9PEZI|nr:L-amino acid oxidase [Plectosphaerella plurivora]
MALRFSNSSFSLPDGIEVPDGLRAAAARHHLDHYLRDKKSWLDDKEYKTLPRYTIPSHDELKDQVGHQGPGHYDKRVCIVGAGAAGLYTAMMLKWLGITNVDIIEAADHVGGRCYTYKFTDPTPCTHNYYDVGAMRFPDIPSMFPTKNLIQHDQLLNIPGKLVEYVYRIKDPETKQPYEPTCYWDSNSKLPDGSKFDEAIKGVLTAFTVNLDKYFLEGNDNMSTRSYLMQKAGLTYEQTMAGELNDTSTGLFDQALTETLCDNTDFQQSSDKPWYRVEGGMSVVTDTMAALVQSTSWPQKKGAPSPAINISLSTSVVTMGKSTDGKRIEVETVDAAGNAQPTQKYDMVFSTTAMGPLQRMNLAGLDLPDDVLTGIRALSYDRATKVAIKFKTRWWKDLYRGNDRWGGVSGSDLPISNVVYPSWDDGEDNANVLMVSYSWAQDATRMGSLVPDYTKTAPQKSDPIVALCLQNLVKLWANQGSDPPSFEQLMDDYVSHHAWAWSHDPNTGGAFALFGPGQFGHLYPRFLQTFCNNKFALCGEALSAHHAWISGALDSAYGAVMRWLLGKHMIEEASRLKASPFGGGVDKHSEEFDDTTLHWSAELSGTPLEVKDV